MSLLLYVILAILLFPTIYILGFPIWFDLLIWILLILILRKKVQIFLTCSLIIVLAFIINFNSPQHKKIYWRPHDKFADEFSYKKNINTTMEVEHGDLYKLDDAINSKKEFIKEGRKIKFVTDKFGFRNDKYEINDAEIILIGDSFIIGTGTTQEKTPANQLSDISLLRVASLAYVGSPKDYEILAEKYINSFNKNSKIILFYFEGNDFWENKDIHISFNTLIRKKYLHMEINKDRILKKIYSSQNIFFRKVRRMSHTINKKLFYEDKLSPVKIEKIGNEYVGFHKTYSSRKDETYIFKNNKILKKLIGVFFIPSKARTYSQYINLKLSNESFNFLKNGYKKIDIPVIDLSELFVKKSVKELDNNNYLYWRDDTHWNALGINIAMQCVNKFIKLKYFQSADLKDTIKFNC